MNKKSKQDNNIPLSLSAASGNMEGEINLQWDAVAGANYYIIQSSLKKAWKEIDAVSNTTYTAAHLKGGKEYSFRVAAVCKCGQSGWSEAITKKSP